MSAYDDFNSSHDLLTLVARHTGREVRYGKNIQCPFHDDGTPSFSVYVDKHDGKQKYKCFGCPAGGDAVAFIAATENISMSQVVSGERGQSRPYTPPPQKHVKTAKSFDVAHEQVVSWRNALQDHALFIEWLEARGISSEAAYTYELGFIAGWNGYDWISIPLYDFNADGEAELVGVERRRDPYRDHEPYTDKAPKYKTNGDKVPFNLTRVMAGNANQLVILETAFDAVLWQSVVGEDYQQAIAANIGLITSEHVGLLGIFGDILIVADNEERGLSWAQDLKRMIRRAQIIHTKHHKDLGELAQADIMRARRFVAKASVAPDPFEAFGIELGGVIVPLATPAQAAVSEVRS